MPIIDNVNTHYRVSRHLDVPGVFFSKNEKNNYFVPLCCIGELETLLKV